MCSCFGSGDIRKKKMSDKDSPGLLKAVWFIFDTQLGNKQESWSPLWRRDSDKLENLYKKNDINGNISISCTLFSVNIATRLAINAYEPDAKPRKIIRGTWFWKNFPKYIPFEETTASSIESWYQSILVGFIQ